MNEVTQQSKELHDAACALQAGMEHLPQVECPVRHFFSPGIYLREMTIPSGTVVVGAVHKHEHYAILSKGRVRLSTEEGVVELTAPAIVHSYPGIKRICYAIEEAVFTTAHHNPSNTQDHEQLTRDHTDATYDTLLGGKNNVQARNNALAAERAKELA